MAAPWVPLTRENLEVFMRRLEGIQSDSRPRWGTLTPPALMRHLRHLVEISLGEASEPDRSNFATRTVVRWLFMHVITLWPAAKFKAPPSLTPPPEEGLEAERAKLAEKLERFVAAADAAPARRTMHPIFGPTTMEYWRRMHGIHFRHHFRQYGVDGI